MPTLLTNDQGRRWRRSDVAARAMPPWTAEEADVDVVCGLHQRVADVYPVVELDVMVVGIFHQVRLLCARCCALVCILWASGGWGGVGGRCGRCVDPAIALGGGGMRS